MINCGQCMNMKERNRVWFTRVWGHEYVITSLWDPVWENKNRSAPIPWGYSRQNLIRSHAPRLPGRRPSSAVHLFGKGKNYQESRFSNKCDDETWEIAADQEACIDTLLNTIWLIAIPTRVPSKLPWIWMKSQHAYLAHHILRLQCFMLNSLASLVHRYQH